ncbi:hypothetical protein EU805_05895 [Salipiger sp. IMCC34102]|uniref:hypothetical protein n=1 Tax=Salipiger sp. IMCC34102 TaxID=2510647 RepID=UPI00101BAF6B|nr:hypothetical protein [Salipiger sp. IMCC34102]RYH03254.1 hypothetical protein EU805_05895 [Salipiger sp. IMCC34102]
MTVSRSLPLLFLLAGCGGGGGGEAAVDPQPVRTEVVERLESRIAREPVSDPAVLPNQGRAFYEGFMRATLPTGPNGERIGYIGDMEMNVNFGAARDEIAGQADGFQTGDGDRLAGRLDIAGGDIFRDTEVRENYTFTGDVDGDLRRGDDTYRIDAGIEGEFKGADQTAVSGLLFGDVTGPLGQDVFDGSFAGEKQRE